MVASLRSGLHISSTIGSRATDKVQQIRHLESRPDLKARDTRDELHLHITLDSTLYFSHVSFLFAETSL